MQPLTETDSPLWTEWNGSHYLSADGNKTGWWLLRNEDATLWHIIATDGFCKGKLPLNDAKARSEELYLAQLTTQTNTKYVRQN